MFMIWYITQCCNIHFPLQNVHVWQPEKIFCVKIESFTIIESYLWSYFWPIMQPTNNVVASRHKTIQKLLLMSNSVMRLHDGYDAALKGQLTQKFDHHLFSCTSARRHISFSVHKGWFNALRTKNILKKPNKLVWIDMTLSTRKLRQNFQFGVNCLFKA